MTIRVAIHHKTHYEYSSPVALSPHAFRLRPAVHSRTPIEAYSFRVTPKKHFINWQQDPFGNFLARVVFLEKTRVLDFEVDLIADMTVINPFDFFVEEFAKHYPFQYPPQLLKELAPYLEIREDGPELKKWLASIKADNKPEIVDFLVETNQRLQKDIGYVIRMEPGVQSCEETLSKALGSCRDTGWLLVQIMRHLGLAARFVSGYLIQLTADVKSLDGPSGPKADFTDLHAWCEVYVPGAGWVGLDPTSGLFAGEGHIPLACTPGPESAAPITGDFWGNDDTEVEFFHSNEVRRFHEDPRVTKPYTEDQWSRIQTLGQYVDRQLEAGDIRLTMGGEPTFVSIDDMESAQWNIAALGAHKRELAGNLLGRLWRRFGSGGVLQHAQGKWYPGEPLPRWSLGCFWRADGTSIWRRPELLAEDGKDYGCDHREAARFAEALTQTLGIDPDYVAPAYEDVFYQSWEAENLPVDLDPLKAAKKDTDEHRRLAALLNRGLETPAGYVLPLRWDDDGQSWVSVHWPFRRNQLFLTPGDSPIGYRLPLDRLPWRARERRRKEPAVERSLFEPLPPLGDYYGEVTRRFSRVSQINLAQDRRQEMPLADNGPAFEDAATDRVTDVFHTALCVEAREGRIHIFMPPLVHLEHFLDLVASIEATADRLDMPVRLEGYEPPHDYRLKRLMVTPDPGVIEVNVHPAHNWRELVDITESLYEEAHFSRLGTEKFMLDGRHAGTGGGNHVTLGGATPADSPFLRRPDLLRSLITYWQHHPALSYLFSGLFIGPTSQAPRVDEARDDSLYELEIAFREMPEGEVPEPWLVDRLLRHLLVDVTGNTHRAEFCIDKLYSPDSQRGRLGLVEFRAFEMPPHARMAAVQMLLLRTLIAYFWHRPYKKDLARWGTELHDRFMLPHYVARDMEDVVLDLRNAGFAFEAEWLDPFLEFRFPHYGTVRVGDIKLELRWAIEPWHVLGEEVSNVGTARFVDSSVERVQVKLNGLTDSRYVLTCNGRRVPLHNTGTQGEYVAGVRYRAWQPPSALHPTIGIHSPLVFDIIDTWHGRSIGGCTYYVGHPGGRHYDVFPVNAYVAETRRVSRFWGFGHTPGRIEPPPEYARMGQFVPEGSGLGPAQPPTEDVNPDYPHTLDMRKRSRWRMS
ncbi:MAG: transglutaminase family protein [Pseudomonadota bacterium]|nr:transglutaminase family protein [Pseudomonadota bacterium]